MLLIVDVESREKLAKQMEMRAKGGSCSEGIKDGKIKLFVLKTTPTSKKKSSWESGGSKVIITKGQMIDKIFDRSVAGW